MSDNQRICSQALDRAALLIGTALGANVLREQMGPEAGDVDEIDQTALVTALSEGDSNAGEYLMGSTTPFEFTHGAAFELLIVGGSDDVRKARRDRALMEASAAIAADPTLGGLVDWAELIEPDPDVA